MFTSYIGKKFLEYYKEAYNKPMDYTAEQFFDEIMFPLFFDDERHLMHVTNSPFFQKPNDDEIKLTGSKTLSQYKSFKKKVLNGNFGGEILVGAGSTDNKATTSGQVSNIQSIYSSEDIYYSWIGQALAVNVKGGISILFDEKEILLHIQKGWEIYSDFYNQTPGLKDKQIETWNGNYLVLSINNTDSYVDYNKINCEIIEKKLSIQTRQWTETVFVLCKFLNTKNINFYAYTLSQTNSTFGFFQLMLHEINQLYEFRDKYFIEEKNTVLTDEQILKLEPFFSFKIACMQGVIGLKSIEPNGLRNYIPKNSLLYAKGSDIDLKKETNYYVYKLWIMTMLNKKELLELSKQFAKILYDYVANSQKDQRGKTTYKSRLDEIFNSKTSRSFIDKITELISKENADILKNLVEEVVVMPRDNFPLFLTLIKFEYNYLQINKE